MATNEMIIEDFFDGEKKIFMHYTHAKVLMDEARKDERSRFKYKRVKCLRCGMSAIYRILSGGKE